MSNLVEAEPNLEIDEALSSKRLDPRKFWTGAFREKLDEVPDELLAKPEAELLTMFKPSRSDWFLRIRFWQLVAAAEENQAVEVKTTHLFRDICSAKYFYKEWLIKPIRVAFLLHPLADEKEYAQEVYHYAMLKIRNFVLNNEVTTDNAGEFIRIAKFMSDRGFGMVTQKVEQRTISANVDLNKPILSPDELKQKIRELEAGHGINVTSETKYIDVSPSHYEDSDDEASS